MGLTFHFVMTGHSLVLLSFLSRLSFPLSLPLSLSPYLPITPLLFKKKDASQTSLLCDKTKPRKAEREKKRSLNRRKREFFFFLIFFFQFFPPLLLFFFQTSPRPGRKRERSNTGPFLVGNRLKDVLELQVKRGVALSPSHSLSFSLMCELDRHRISNTTKPGLYFTVSRSGYHL